MNYEKRQELINKHLCGWHGLEKASIQNYAETGKISGNLSLAIHKMLEEYASQQRTEGIKEGFEAARLPLVDEGRNCGDLFLTVEGYLNSK